MGSLENEMYSLCQSPEGAIAQGALGIKDLKVILFPSMFFSEFPERFEVCILHSFIILKT